MAVLIFFYVCKMGTITQEVALKDLRFFSPIGYYAEERILGNEFFVDVIVSFPFQNEASDELRNTLNYEELYAIVRAAMGQERKLLESAAEEILQTARLTFAFAAEIRVAIRKTTPPFGIDHVHTQVSLVYKK